jgi:cyclase
VVCVPVITSGGVGEPKHVGEALRNGAHAVAVADALHYNRCSVQDLHQAMRDAGGSVRTIPGIDDLSEAC